LLFVSPHASPSTVKAILNIASESLPQKTFLTATIMSQDYFHDGYASSSSSQQAPQTPRTDPPPQHHRPNYLQVGNGSRSDAAERLQNMLDDDSGYGGSMRSGYSAAFDPNLIEDSPLNSPARLGMNSPCKYG